MTQSAARRVNRAEVVDEAFLRHLSALEQGRSTASDGGSIASADLLELFDSQMVSRQLDLMARVKRAENKVFYTIGSSGHEGNALVGRLTRHTDPAFLHYRSGAFMAERYRNLPDRDFVADTCLSFAASTRDPASGGRHKVWGSQPLWVLPQTSTIASHLPKAVGTALALARGARDGHDLPVPPDSIVVCSFGDASLNHAAAQAAFNACAWSRHQNLPVPILFVCEDNGLGISVPSPRNWVHDSMARRHGLTYRRASGLDLAEGYQPVSEAIAHCRERRTPVFLHLDVTRLMGHAGTDFEIDYRSPEDLAAAEARDPLLRSAERVVVRGLMQPEQIRRRYEQLRQRCLEAADRADQTPRLASFGEVVGPLAPVSTAAVMQEARRSPAADARAECFGGPDRLPEAQEPRHLAIQINRALTDLMLKIPEALVFGEDVARKGGVYTVTRGLWSRFGQRRVFNTLLDETTILGLAQGYAMMGYLPIPEIQYLAYFHNACDQIRGEACSLQFFSNDQFRNPMVLRIAGLGYQRGFGGHFHNDNSIAALRDIPGLVIGCPARGDDAAMMLRTMAAMARVDGRVCALIEPIALYMTKDLHEPDDGGWLFPYPAPEQSLEPFRPRVYHEQAADLLIVTYGNGVPMALRCAARMRARGISVRVLDLRWLKPLDLAAVARHGSDCAAIVVFDEGRPDGGVGEAVVTGLVEAGLGGKPVRRVTGRDCYIPLGDAARLVLASEEQLDQAAQALLTRPREL
ncbi:transketolase C-terminal domain-containing protein [Wenzhouxiangella limi]|uniref:3-methyl-2-oxobutanoate dehydrogenase (2-methylpropanoyl-transferring) n=1 Tax=Wenzhouxiangella limi TaxID=2707351 RepID=A0A845V619_9GAMM|nr:transketolase C-terminal domain-containing protein [Wenzhouxiangella limi]NDY95415.1 MFS transporter [Wenzhouxiangella limi]